MPPFFPPAPAVAVAPQAMTNESGGEASEARLEAWRDTAHTARGAFEAWCDAKVPRKEGGTPSPSSSSSSPSAAATATATATAPHPPDACQTRVNDSLSRIESLIREAAAALAASPTDSASVRLVATIASDLPALDAVFLARGADNFNVMSVVWKGLKKAVGALDAAKSRAAVPAADVLVPCAKRLANASQRARDAAAADADAAAKMKSFFTSAMCGLLSSSAVAVDAAALDVVRGEVAPPHASSETASPDVVAALDAARQRLSTAAPAPEEPAPPPPPIPPPARSPPPHPEPDEPATVADLPAAVLSAAALHAVALRIAPQPRPSNDDDENGVTNAHVETTLIRLTRDAWELQPVQMSSAVATALQRVRPTLGDLDASTCAAVWVACIAPDWALPSALAGSSWVRDDAAVVSRLRTLTALASRLRPRSTSPPTSPDAQGGNDAVIRTTLVEINALVAMLCLATRLPNARPPSPAAVTAVSLALTRACSASALDALISWAPHVNAAVLDDVMRSSRTWRHVVPRVKTFKLLGALSAFPTMGSSARSGPVSHAFEASLVEFSRWCVASCPPQLLSLVFEGVRSLATVASLPHGVHNLVAPKRRGEFRLHLEMAGATNAHGADWSALVRSSLGGFPSPPLGGGPLGGPVGGMRVVAPPPARAFEAAPPPPRKRARAHDDASEHEGENDDPAQLISAALAKVSRAVRLLRASPDAAADLADLRKRLLAAVALDP